MSGGYQSVFDDSYKFNAENWVVSLIEYENEGDGTKKGYLLIENMDEQKQSYVQVVKFPGAGSVEVSRVSGGLERDQLLTQVGIGISSKSVAILTWPSSVILPDELLSVAHLGKLEPFNSQLAAHQYLFEKFHIEAPDHSNPRYSSC